MSKWDQANLFWKIAMICQLISPFIKTFTLAWLIYQVFKIKEQLNQLEK